MPFPTRDFTLSHRYTYTPAQLQAYFHRIGLPKAELSSPIATSLDARKAPPEEQLRFLSLLQRRNLASIPFENLDLHYSQHHVVTIDPAAVFEKIVTNGQTAPSTHNASKSNGASNGHSNGNSDGTNGTNSTNGAPARASTHTSHPSLGRGGYCMENSLLLSTILRSLHYNLLPVGARVNEAAQPMAGNPTWAGPKFDGWNHMLNLVLVGGQWYLVDVGFGSAGPVRPVPLVEGEKSVRRNVGAQEYRLVRRNIEQYTNGGQELWVYEHRNGPGEEGDESEGWIPTYCFTEREFLPEDFQMMNFFVSNHRSSWFTWYVVCVRMLLRSEMTAEERGREGSEHPEEAQIGDGEDEVVGDVTMFEGEVKRRILGRSETVAKLKTEEDRIRFLREGFGIELSEAQKAGVRGMRSELI